MHEIISMKKLVILCLHIKAFGCSYLCYGDSTPDACLAGSGLGTITNKLDTRELFCDIKH